MVMVPEGELRVAPQPEKIQKGKPTSFVKSLYAFMAS